MPIGHGICGSTSVDATTRHLSDSALEEAAQLLVQQKVAGDSTLVTAARRSGLVPADAAQLGAAVTDATPYARGGNLEWLLEYAAREPDPSAPTLRMLLPPTGRHARTAWIRLAGILALGKCPCGQPRDDGRFLQCDRCRENGRHRVKRHRNARRKAARAMRYRTPGIGEDEAARRAQRWRERVRSHRLPKITPTDSAALRLEAFPEYGPNGCSGCGETDVRVLHLHHPDFRGKYWRKVAGGSTTRELLQLQKDGWSRGHLEVVCFACHAVAHGQSIDAVARQRARMDRITGPRNGGPALHLGAVPEYTRAAVTPAVPAQCSIH